MTDNIDVAKLLDAISTLSSEQPKHGQEFLLGDVVNHSRQAYAKYREDPVIRQFAYIVEQMAGKYGAAKVTNQAELTDIYNSVARTSENNNFRSVLGGFLLESPVKTASSADNDDFIRTNRGDSERESLDITAGYVDRGLTGDLARAFGTTNDLDKRAYDNEAAETGKRYVELELKSLGHKQPRVEMLNGDNTVLVYGAHIDTERGMVSVAIPLELSSGRVLLPSTFVADDHLQELTAENLNSFIEKKAARRDFSSTEAHSNIRTADPEKHLDVQPQAKMPEELAHIASDFEDGVLESASTFGREAINRGKGIVASELSTSGFKNAQVRFGSETDDSAIYLAALHTPNGALEIEVPIEMKETSPGNYTPLAPTVFASDGLIEDFTPTKLQRFAIRQPAASTGQMLYSTAHQYMNYGELRDEIIKAASDDDFVTAEMVLGTVQERFGEETFRNAAADYHYILTCKQGMKQVEQKSCPNPIAAGKGSIEARCSHLGVPMSKVVVGEDGQCRLKSHIEKERLNPLDETGGSISTSKLFWT